MKVIVIGGEGTIGRPVADALSARHEVVRVGRNGETLDARAFGASGFARHRPVWS
ncbi:MAG TPA: hypothetical protein VK422_19530 [Pyrinomonadaceae bacterium]|nr:hypothetical protein [Pyrinomonadaceae bacterium]